MKTPQSFLWQTRQERRSTSWKGICFLSSKGHGLHNTDSLYWWVSVCWCVVASHRPVLPVFDSVTLQHGQRQSLHVTGAHFPSILSPGRAVSSWVGGNATRYPILCPCVPNPRIPSSGLRGGTGARRGFRYAVYPSGTSRCLLHHTDRADQGICTSSPVCRPGLHQTNCMLDCGSEGKCHSMDFALRFALAALHSANGSLEGTHSLSRLQFLYWVCRVLV